jgi:zinc protease
MIPRIMRPFLPSFACLVLIAGVQPAVAESDYVILISKATQADKGWSGVADALAAKHSGAKMVTYETEATKVLPALKAAHPRWLCWVARPEELGVKAVAEMHRLVRSIDDDSYPDAFWGIVTGRDAASANDLASHAEPLIVRKVVANTEFAMECVEQGKWFSELKQGEVWTKIQGGQATKGKGDDDSTAGLADYFNKQNPDAILTSGHASEKDWMPGYSYKNGVFANANGKVLGKALDGSVHVVDSPNPKVYLGIGNCLIGNVPGTADCMATAWMHCGGVKQFAGYTVPSWFGYGGWGMLDYFVEQPGRFSLTESYRANQLALNWKLANNPDATERKGLEYDRDVVVLYGDPRWDARMAPGALRWTEDFKEIETGVFIWTITPTAGEESFATVNRNGSQRGGRPLVRFLPRRFARLELLEGAGWKPVLGDDFVLLPRPAKTSGKIVLRFKASL